MSEHEISEDVNNPGVFIVTNVKSGQLMCRYFADTQEVQIINNISFKELMRVIRMVETYAPAIEVV